MVFYLRALRVWSWGWERQMPVAVIQGRPLDNGGSEEANWDAEIMPVKHSHTRHQNKAVGFGQRPRPLHNRYTRKDTFFRWRMAVTNSRYKFVTVPLPKQFRNGRFTYESAARRFQKLFFEKSYGTLHHANWVLRVLDCTRRGSQKVNTTRPNGFCKQHNFSA
jgi:hypothetical protein